MSVRRCILTNTIKVFLFDKRTHTQTGSVCGQLLLWTARLGSRRCLIAQYYPALILALVFANQYLYCLWTRLENKDKLRHYRSKHSQASKHWEYISKCFLVFRCPKQQQSLPCLVMIVCDLPSLLSDIASAAFLPFLLHSSPSGPETSHIHAHVQQAL